MSITVSPAFNWGNTTGCWAIFGATSAATPQTAALVALVNAARASQGKQPIGLLDPLLYKAVGAADYADIVPQHYGSAPKIFAGAEAGVSDPMFKSVGTDRHHQ
jgi:subtilase family serine protease